MNPVFLDTSGLIGVVNADDQWHDDAATIWGELAASGAPLFTTTLVLIELGDGLARLQHRAMAIELYDRLHRSSRIEVVRPTSEDEEQAWQLYRERSDKEWGMTDCVSMVVMEDREVQQVFSSDHHFEQAGYEILLKVA